MGQVLYILTPNGQAVMVESGHSIYKYMAAFSLSIDIIKSPLHKHAAIVAYLEQQSPVVDLLLELVGCEAGLPRAHPRGQAVVLVLPQVDGQHPRLEVHREPAAHVST